METLKLGTLGTLRLTSSDGRDLSRVLAQPKRFAILVYLALSRPRGYHRRDSLLPIFWRESDEGRGRNSLSQSLTFLRRELPAGLIQTRGNEEVGVDHGRISTDVEVLRKTLAAGQWAEALDLYTGELLRGFHVSDAVEFEAWLEVQRRQLRRSVADAAWSLADEQIQRGALVDAERTGRRALSFVGSDETRVRELIRALAAAGDRAAAIRTYEQFRDRLREELEIEPSARTRDVAESIRDGGPIEPAGGSREAGEVLAGTEPERSPGESLAAESGPDGRSGPHGREPPSESPLLPTPQSPPPRHPATASAAGAGLRPGPPSRYRRAAALAILVVLAATAAAITAAAGGGSGPMLHEDLVVVLPFQDLSGSDSTDVLAEVVTYQVATLLARSGLVQVVQPGAVLQWWNATEGRRTEDPEFLAAQAISEDLNAGLLVQGEILLQGDSIRLTAGYVDAERLAELQRPLPVVVSMDSLERGLRVLADRLAGGMAQYLDRVYGGGTLSRYSLPPPSLDAWRQWKDARQAWLDGDFQRWLQHTRTAVALDSTFLWARSGMAVSLLNIGRLAQADSILRELEPHRDKMPMGERAYYDWAVAMVAGDLQRGYEVAKGNVHTYPSNHWMWGRMALATNRLEEAVEVLEDLDPDQPMMEGLASYWTDLAVALHMLGKHGRELRQVLRARDRYPHNPRILQAEIRARAALGQVDEVEELVGEALRGTNPVGLILTAGYELRAHRHDDAAMALGERGLAHLRAQSADAGRTATDPRNVVVLLYLLERWPEAYDLSSELVAEHPGNPTYLWDLGRLAARTGREAQARRISRELASMEGPYDLGLTSWRRAHIAAILGDEAEAVRLLREGHDRGHWFWWGVDQHAGPDLTLLQGYPPFEELLRPRG